MRDLIEGFLAFKQSNQGRSARTAQVYGLALGRLEVFLAGADPLRASTDELLAFTGPWLHKQGLDPASRKTHVAAVREFYAWLRRSGRMKTNPAEGVSYPRAAKRLPRLMTLANAERLMWAPDFETFEGVRDGAMLGMLIGCGLRASGLVSLNESNLVQEEVDGKPRMLLRVEEKGKKTRAIPVPVEADLLLRLYLEHPELKEIDREIGRGDKVLFVSTRNRTCPPHEYHGERRRMNRRAVIDLVARHGRRAGIPEEQLHPHALRHLYGTELAEGDVDLLVRQKLMGHADPKSTEIYTHLATRKLTRESDRANPMAKMRTPVSDLLKRLRKGEGK
jgi:site-specific recombinase XerD